MCPNSLSCSIRLSLSRSPKQLHLLNLRLSVGVPKCSHWPYRSLSVRMSKTFRMAESESGSQAVQNDLSSRIGSCLSKIFSNLQLEKSVIFFENVENPLTGRVRVCQSRRKKRSLLTNQGVSCKVLETIQLAESNESLIVFETVRPA